MMDLRNHLEEIAGSAPATTVGQVDADLARGRQALRRRRTGRAVAGSAFGVAALVAAVAVAGAGGGFDSGPPAGPGGDRPAVASAVQLVAYKGEQPKGFTIDKVPDGFFIQSSENYSLTLAPRSAQNPGPDVNPSTNPVYDPNSYVGKIGIMLESRDQNGPSRKGLQVTVDGQPATLLKSLPGVTPDGPAPTRADGDTGSELWVRQPSGVYLIVQFWEGLGMSQAQMVELGAGVHVLKAALQARG
jgi:hypothetical protein